ncbi:MAG: hypothetical protein IKJ27_00215 [Clostridia bacterium]|nr:hypothetical protein [Clostridia bacterium]
MGRNVNEILSNGNSVPEENNNPATPVPEENTVSAKEGPGTCKKAEEKLSIYVPRLPNSKNQPPLEGSINGKPFALPRGVWSEVSPAVYEIVSRSLQNQDEADDYYNSVNAMLNKRAKQEAGDLE